MKIMKPASVQETLRIELMNAEESAYESLSLTNSFPYWIISHVLDGSVVTGTLEESFTVNAGQVMVHPPNIPFSETAAGPGTHQWMMFEAKNAFELDLLMLYPLSYVVTLRNPSVFGSLFHDLLHYWREPHTPLRELGCFSIAGQLLFEVIHSWQLSGSPARAGTGNRSDRIAHAIRFMMENLDSSVTREEIAERTFIHPVHLDRIFRQVYRKTPKQMLREMRLNKAKNLLQSTGLPLADIAVRSGLGDASYMSRVFAKQFGMTPGAFRERTATVNLDYLSRHQPADHV